MRFIDARRFTTFCLGKNNFFRQIDVRMKKERVLFMTIDNCAGGKNRERISARFKAKIIKQTD